MILNWVLGAPKERKVTHMFRNIQAPQKIKVFMNFNKIPLFIQLLIPPSPPFRKGGDGGICGYYRNRFSPARMARPSQFSSDAKGQVYFSLNWQNGLKARLKSISTFPPGIGSI